MTERSASIDDLLYHDEEPAPRARRHPSGVRQWVKPLLVAAAATAVTVFGLRMFSVEISMVAVFAGYLALLALRRLVAAVDPPPPPATRVRHDDGTYNWAERDALRNAVNRWETVLARAQSDRDLFNRAVLPALCELVDERLRQRHGLTRASDPDRARALLTDPLWKFLANPATRKPKPDEIAAVVAQLEKL